MNAIIRQSTQGALLVLAVYLLMGALSARAEDLSRPVMLVASPLLQGGYSKTVLVAVPRGSVHVGFILNRATGVKLATLFPSHPPSAKVADSVYFGGPQDSKALFAVLNRNPGGEAWQLFDGYFVAFTSETIDRIIEQTPNDARYFGGFVGWMPGQLEKEIAAGWWYATDPDTSLLRRDPSGAWESLVNKLGNGHPIQRGLIGASLKRD